jgi:anion-transporting  ArsA/GET3 family ATPase
MIIKPITIKSWAESQIIICIGSGGVGKTTVSAALGVWGAMMGRKTLVLTVDPSLRLAQTLGIQSDGEDHRVELPNDFTGSLYASVINSKKIFNDFVIKASSRSAQAERLFKNKLYQQLSTTLSGSQEFTSLEKLYSSFESKKYDLIILDTPPTKHAIDFLKAPEKISILFSESITKWFRTDLKNKGFFQKLMFTGTQKVLQALQAMTGIEFIDELRDFFINIEVWQEKLAHRTEQVKRLLMDSKTTFNLITAYDAAKLAEAEYFAEEIKKRGFHLKSLIINRSFPDWLPNPTHSGSELDLFCTKLNDYYGQRLASFKKIPNSASLEILHLPEYQEDIYDVNGLIKIMRDFREFQTN